MLWDLSGNPDVPDEAMQRWSIAKAAIARAVTAYTDKLPLGITFFPSDDLCGSDTSLRVPPAYGSQDAILAALRDGGLSPDGGGIPTCGAISKTANALAGEQRDSYLLLVTGGLPSCDATCFVDPHDPAASAVTALTAAGRASHPVKTFVLGIGSLPMPDRAGLTRMADAGGVPDRSNPTLKFFNANDVAALDAALERIMRQLIENDAGVVCDDSCTASGCADPAEVCVSDRCRPDPCRALSCRPSEYCYSTGTDARCAAPCDHSCPEGSRCSLGACIPDACDKACGPAAHCDTPPRSGPSFTPGACVPDPACAAVRCPGAQACFAGVCRDDPCRYTSCPSGLSCVPFDGSCVRMERLPSESDGDDELMAGCAIGHRESRAAALSAAALYASYALLLLARRRRAQARART
jgi:hypothetical protein